METRRSFLLDTLCVILAASPAVAFPQDKAALLKQSSIVFTGSVTRLGASSFPSIPVSPRTIVVRVDAVLKKPAAVSLKKNDDVTVEVKDPAAFQEGARATFYTDAWIFGSGVAVKEIGHLTPSRAEAAFGQAQKKVSDEELQERLNAAEVVVIGRVMSVQPWTAPALTGGPTSHISEHAPNWQEAVVQVQSAIKGTDSKQIVVRFPASRDIAWARSPKFQKGQTATFVLKTDEVSGSSKALMAGRQVTAYTALDAGDVLSPADAVRVRALLPHM